MPKLAPWGALGQRWLKGRTRTGMLRRRRRPVVPSGAGAPSGCGAPLFALGGEDVGMACVGAAPPPTGMDPLRLTRWFEWSELLSTNRRRGPNWHSIGLAQEL